MPRAGIALKGYFAGKRTAEAAIAESFPSNGYVVAPSFIYGGDSFVVNPPRVPAGYGGAIEGLLSTGGTLTNPKYDKAEEVKGSSSDTNEATMTPAELAYVVYHSAHNISTTVDSQLANAYLQSTTVGTVELKSKAFFAVDSGACY
eukprot:1467510-Pyramimonas_sp.AAC.1